MLYRIKQIIKIKEELVCLKKYLKVEIVMNFM